MGISSVWLRTRRVNDKANLDDLLSPATSRMPGQDFVISLAGLKGHDAEGEPMAKPRAGAPAWSRISDFKFRAGDRSVRQQGPRPITWQQR